MDELKKMQLIYSGELFVFVIIASVLGALFLANIIQVKEWKKWAFTIVTLLGGIWLVTDLIWTLLSPKRRNKSCLLDKILPAPSGLTLLVLDIYCLINLIQDKNWTGPDDINIFRFEIGIVLCYVALIYLIEGIYHLKVPHPSILEAYNEELEEKRKAEEEALKKLEETSNNEK